jgi:hypothetical protein
MYLSTKYVQVAKAVEDIMYGATAHDRSLLLDAASSQGDATFPYLSALCLQVAKAVEDILYAATQEEGEACLAAAIAELEAAGGAAPADDAQQPEGMEQLQQQLQEGLGLQQQQQQELQLGNVEEQEVGYAGEGVDQLAEAAAAVPVC